MSGIPVSGLQLRRLDRQLQGGTLFIRSLLYARGIVSQLALQKGQHTFWRHTASTHLGMAVLFWCRVFGTNSEPMHWKQTIQEQPGFRNAILKATNFSIPQWEAYHAEMIDFRNAFIAHQQLVEGKVPDLTPALEVVKVANAWLRTEIGKIAPDYLVEGELIVYSGPLDIDLYVENIAKEVEIALAKIFANAAEIQTYQ